MNCAECGKPILYGQPSYRANPMGLGMGNDKVFHSGCGDLFGLKARDAEIARLKTKIADLAPFLAIWAGQYQREHQLDGLHPVHYDMLAETGARMESFKRATNSQH